MFKSSCRVLALAKTFALLSFFFPRASAQSPLFGESQLLPADSDLVDLTSAQAANEMLMSALTDVFNASESTIVDSNPTPSITDTPLSSSAAEPSAFTAAGGAITMMRERRIPMIVADVSVSPEVGAPNITGWISTLSEEGKWPDAEIDYTSGCEAQRANWPAEIHWARIDYMAAAWLTGVKGADEFVNSSSLLDAVSRGMNYWFNNDYSDQSCLGGQCKCGTPGFWNPNWFSNVIGIPRLVGEGCLLIGTDTLTESQLNGCKKMLSRTAATLRDGVPGMSALTGANTLDVAKIAVDLGLLTNNDTAIADAYQHAHSEVVVHNATKSDGIRPDGSFGQHSGVLYNGNYGKDYANDVLALEVIAGGTQYSAQNTDTGSQEAFESLLDADRWMMYRNVETGVLHWDFSVLNRMISFPVADDQATSSIMINTSQIEQLGSEWNSTTLQSVYQGLSEEGKDANVGNLTGNRMFFANDYMVHRGPGYVTTLKMFSSRTVNSECINEQNPYGSHLSDGTLYTYLNGTEYSDIAGAWDWNLIPGTTTDYAATKLSCDKTTFSSKEAFVGGVSDGKIGAAAMRYTNPATGSLSFQKAWFFLDEDVQHIMVSAVNSSSSQAHPVISVLDQKRLNGVVYVDGKQLTEGGNFSTASSLWHDNVGYTVGQGAMEGTGLSVEFGSRQGDWRPLGISKLAHDEVSLFSAWLTHGAGTKLAVPMEYTSFPAVDRDRFQVKSAQASQMLKTIQNDVNISAVYDEAHHTAMFVFWSEHGGSASFSLGGGGGDTVTVEASGNAMVLYKLDDGVLTVSDPSQSLSNLQLSITTGRAQSRALNVTLPAGGEAGKSVFHVLK